MEEQPVDHTNSCSVREMESLLPWNPGALLTSNVNSQRRGQQSDPTEVDSVSRFADVEDQAIGVVGPEEPHQQQGVPRQRLHIKLAV